jgi:hypothetical protein
VGLSTYTDWAEFKYKGDVWGDRVIEKIAYDTRESWIFFRPTDYLDIIIGRQVLTWGTGDLCFVNDMFPKDWQSYFIGRDKAYLKAPSDASKISIFLDFVNIDMVYIPRFIPDRYITGEYISYWNSMLKQRTGRDFIIESDRPDQWFQDDEIAVRLYRNLNNYELALYAYHGFWKCPGGQTTSGLPIFPELHVYGFSARGQVASGIGNIESAWYQSIDDKKGTNPLVKNSEIRYLIGYAQDLAKDCNASLQYYIEHMIDYNDHIAGHPFGLQRDQNRHVLTLQLTQLLMNQNLELSFSLYYSPSDEDTYFRPGINYKFSDKITMQSGANIFSGKEKDTFFGQFENSTNIYGAVRLSF